ncbi:ribonuclease H-like domain-containing protein [Tanacetum coccineum]|uniref:Ribonuclease H-like domain-containing protein n=1 Tax=Tanacetum coccineum TaxID=301880 RepID=A0ABQ5CHT1_9ASTR
MPEALVPCTRTYRKQSISSGGRRFPTGRYVVPTGRVIATVSTKVPTGSRKRTDRDTRGNKGFFLCQYGRQLLYQRETKARTILLQSLPEDHMKVLSQLYQMKARTDMKTCTEGSLELYHLHGHRRNQPLKTRGCSVAPTHSAFISAASTNSKWSTADSKCQPSSVSYTTTSSSADASGNVLENVLHSFVAESDPQQQITYEDFDQIGKLDLEELDIKWQMAMLSVRINRFEKKAGRKFKFNNKDAARFDKKKVRCYQCSELGHFARECTGKKVDSKTSEDMEKGASEVYGMIVGYGDDAVIPAVDAADGVSTDGIFADGVFVATGNVLIGVSVVRLGVGTDGVSVYVTSSDVLMLKSQFCTYGVIPSRNRNNNIYSCWPGSLNNQMDYGWGRWGNVLRTSAGCCWQSNGPYHSIRDPRSMVDLNNLRDNPHTNKDLGTLSLLEVGDRYSMITNTHAGTHELTEIQSVMNNVIVVPSFPLTIFQVKDFTEELLGFMDKHYEANSAQRILGKQLIRSCGSGVLLLHSAEMEGIHHHPTTGIFSESTYDADFGGSIIGDITFTSLTKGKGTLKKSKFGESALAGYVHDQQRNNHTDYLHYDMQEEMTTGLLIRMGKLVPCQKGKTAIGQIGFLRIKRDCQRNSS